MTPYLAARARRRGGRPKAEYRENEIGEAPPSRLERVGLIAGRSADHLNVGRSADRRRWLGAPLRSARCDF
jgi:hypothetical protein